jgi:carbonic anhydrase
MPNLKFLLERNRAWSEAMRRQDPDYFRRLSEQQAPKFLWIGCSDSRVPANQIIDMAPGEVFVHRNVANVVVHTDFNCLSVMEYAVMVLKVKHIIVCGHYGCGGVQAALRNSELGLIDNWLRHIRDVYYKHETRLAQITEEAQRWHKLCELNVIEQVYNVSNTTIVRNAWKRGQELTLHGWVYALKDGLLQDLNVCIANLQEVPTIYDEAIAALWR